MIRPFARVAILLLALGSLTMLADTYRLRTGEVVDGEPISFNEAGVVFRLPTGQFSPRAGWTNFTEEALRKLADIPDAQRFTEEYLIDEEEPEEDAAQLEIKPREHPKLQRLPKEGGVGSWFRSPLSLSLLILIYLANIYAGFEVAIFRNYPVWVGCLAAALLPFVGPIVMLCLPTRLEPIAQPVYEMPAEQYAEETAAGYEYAEGAPVEAAVPAQAQTPAQPQVTVYQRGTTTFNRRFFETKLANFMRVVPSEEDKDMLIELKSARGDYVCTRISRITPNELHVQISKGGASADVAVPFGEIKEIKVGHKDALAKH